MLDLSRYQNWNKAKLMRYARDKHGVNSLFGRISANPKIDKNAKLNVLTIPLHLAPHKLSGHNVCASATSGCAAACLHSAGNPAYMPQKQKSRLARTMLYFADRALFIEIARRELQALARRADRLGMRPAFRPNATSDIRFENVRYHIGDNKEKTLFSEFPQLQAYDYTKHSNRRNLPANYHLTFSLAENNHLQAIEAFNNGMNVAVVFDTKRGQALPETFTIDAGRAGKITAPIIDGDSHDYRPADKRGSIVGLRAKGDAIGDASGFVNIGSARHCVVNIGEAAPFEYIGGHWPANQKKARAIC